MKKYVMNHASFSSLPDTQDLSVDKIADLTLAILQQVTGMEYLHVMTMYSTFFVNIGKLDRAKRTLVSVDRDVEKSVKIIDTAESQVLKARTQCLPLAVTGGLPTTYNWSIGERDKLKAVISTNALLSSYNSIMSLSPGYGFGGRSDASHRMKCFYISSMIGSLVKYKQCSIYVPSIDLINYLVAAWRYYFRMPGPRFEIVVDQSDYVKVPKMYAPFVTTVRTMSPVIVYCVTQVANESKEKKWEAASVDNCTLLKRMYSTIDFIAYTPVFGKRMFEEYRVFEFGSPIGLMGILSNLETIPMMEVEDRVPSVAFLSPVTMGEYYTRYNNDYARRAIWPFSAAWTFTKFYGVIVPLPLNVKYQQATGEVEGTYTIDDWDENFEEEFEDPDEEEEEEEDEEGVPMPSVNPYEEESDEDGPAENGKKPSPTFSFTTSTTDLKTTNVTTTTVPGKGKIETLSSAPRGTEVPPSGGKKKGKSSSPAPTLMGSGDDQVPVATSNVAIGGNDDL